jgi:hypothetical protein
MGFDVHRLLLLLLLLLLLADEPHEAHCSTVGEE